MRFEAWENRVMVMMNYDKRCYCLAALSGCVSVIVIGSTGDVTMIESLRSFRLWAVGAALVCLTVGMYFDCTRLIRLVRMAGYDMTLRQSLDVILSNYCLAMLTPGAMGGPVAQVLVLRKLSIPTSCASLVVLVRTMLSIVFLLACVPVVLWTDTELYARLPMESIMAMAVGCVTFLVIGIVSIGRRSVKRLLLRAIVPCVKVRRRAIWRAYRQVTLAIEFLRACPLSMLCVFADTALSLIFLYAIVIALFLGLGVQADWGIVMGRMILLNLVLYFAPTPGGTGVAEGGFVYLFADIAPSGTVGVLAVAWRILAEYLPFAGGMYVAVKLLGNKAGMAELTRQSSREDVGIRP